MALTVEEPIVEEPRHVSRSYRPVGNAAFRRIDFDERLQPVQPARAVAAQFDGQPAAFRLGEDGFGHLVRAN